MLMSPQIVRYLIYCCVLWLAATRAVRIGRLSRGGARPAASEPLPLVSRMAIAGSAAGSLLGAAGLWFAGGLFFAGEDLAALRVLNAALIVVALCDAFLAWKLSASAAAWGLRAVGAGALFLLGAGVLAFVLHIRSVPGPSSAALRVAYPVRGEWMVFAGGRSALTNPHHGHPTAQDYAVDMVRQSGESAGEAVCSPVDGVVTQAVDGCGPGSAEAEGNVVVIRAGGEQGASGEGVTVWLAHLEEGSLGVRAGDWVAAGQTVARCGATGSAARAHLHIHAERDGRPVPLLFGPEARFLLRNDVFQN